jgi:hypothetical protein
VPALLLATLLHATTLSAQPPRSPWSGSAQLNGSLLFGDTEQRLLGGRVTLSHRDSTYEFGGSVQSLYGEASVPGAGRRVIKRLWLGSLTADWRPQSRWSPFVLATVETNL